MQGIYMSLLEHHPPIDAGRSVGEEKSRGRRNLSYKRKSLSVVA